MWDDISRPFSFCLPKEMNKRSLLWSLMYAGFPAGPINYIPREDWSMLLMRGKTSVDLMKRDLHKCTWYGYIFTISFLSNSHYLAIFSLFLGSTRNQTTIRTCGNRNSHPKEEFSINEYSGQCHWQVYTLDLREGLGTRGDCVWTWLSQFDRMCAFWPICMSFAFGRMLAVRRVLVQLYL